MMIIITITTAATTINVTMTIVVRPKNKDEFVCSSTCLMLTQMVPVLLVFSA